MLYNLSLHLGLTANVFEFLLYEIFVLENCWRAPACSSEMSKKRCFHSLLFGTRRYVRFCPPLANSNNRLAQYSSKFGSPRSERRLRHIQQTQQDQHQQQERFQQHLQQHLQQQFQQDYQIDHGFEHELEHYYYHRQQDEECQQQQNEAEGRRRRQTQQSNKIVRVRSLLSQLDWAKGQLLILQEEDSTDYFRMLFICLMLTSTLAVFSAYDAKHHCQLQEGDWSVLMRDDYNSEDVEEIYVTCSWWKNYTFLRECALGSIGRNHFGCCVATL